MAVSNSNSSEHVRPFNNYKETIDYLYARLPMFTRIGAAAIKPDLTNTLKLCERIDNPQNKFKSIHIAGTNGKGSTSHMLAAILQTAGYKTGLYTSPHLKDFRERIRLNGEMIPEHRVVDFVNGQQSNIEEIDPSFFEVTVALAFDFFANEQVDIAVIEVGLGGRLDSTNIITPLVSVITNIGYDHVNILGDTLPKIASEKAGIIKSGVPVVVGEKHPETAATFFEKSKSTKSKLVNASEEWQITKSIHQDLNQFLKLELKKTEINKSPLSLKEVDLDLTGSYQLKNLATVLSSVSELKLAGFDISDEHIRLALKSVKMLTGLQGRWHILSQKPLIVCDTGHNEDGIHEVLKNINDQEFHKLHMVIGMVKDKEISKILKLLPKNATYYFCNPDMPRAKTAMELKEEAHVLGLIGNNFESVAAALRAAKAAASENDLIFIGGSTFVVAEIL
ncbi:bifunctional folylpolyglutamate synthase/dihydrofolate synthase [Daejeonella lutea]|uniref:Dihydrofolate synthase/folylpolyglutamate synthase n=1 Tax=Daejeonella lutea TaxID=572036 RepID=A0A1T5A1F3_9SPHI|nr:folylpolyglutamate synthase/dihydrofolate synthase family protein [Daejeonella lutea]SKB28864.1 dihydrofolate synthase / folylpolyglutamate synthase [Daejeonella lutea]